MPTPEVKLPIMPEDWTLSMSVKVYASLIREDVVEALDRYGHNDWGDASSDECLANDDALSWAASEVIGSYRDANGVRFRVVTNFAEQVTRILLAEEQ